MSVIYGVTNYGTSDIKGQQGDVTVDNNNVRAAREQLFTDSDTYKAEITKYLQDPADRTYTTGFAFDVSKVPEPVVNEGILTRSYGGYGFSVLDNPGTVDIGEAPIEPEIGTIGYNKVEVPNDYNGFTYTPVFPTTFIPEEIDDPADWDNSIDIQLPADLVLDELADPNIIPITVPVIPQINVPDFTATAPNADGIRESMTSFDFTEIQYSSDVLSDVDVLVQQMLSGGIGIPETIWNSIYEKAGVQIDTEITKQVNQINAEWASKGFSLPQGVQVAQVNDARQNGTNKKAELARDNAIAYSQEEIKNLEFAVQQGIAFEALRGGWHEKEMQRALDVAKYIVESEIQLIQSDIAIINAKTQIFSTEAQVYKTLIEAEIAKLEKYRLDIEVQGLVLKVNDNSIKVYQARIQGLQLLIEEYNSKIKATGIEADLVRTEVQIYSEKVKTFVAKIQAEASKGEIYKTQIEAEGIKMTSYETAAKIYGIDVSTYATKVGALKTETESKIALEELKVTAFDSAIKGYAANASAKSDILKAEVNALNSFIEKEKIAADDKYKQSTFGLEVDKNRLTFMSEQSKVATANALEASRAAEATAKIILDTNKSMALVSAGLAGSIYSAINISSSESIGMNGSIGESTSYDGGAI